MPRSRSTSSSSISREDLIYLAGIFESHEMGGLRGIGTQSAIAISRKEDWPKIMAEKFGGTASEFTASKTGKKFWGWYVPIERRKELARLLEDSKLTFAVGPFDWDGIRGKFEKGLGGSQA